MLRSYNAELKGTALVWLGKPPPEPMHARVVVVIEEAAEPAPCSQKTGRYDFTQLAGRLQWEGDAVAAQRELRDAW